MGEGPCSLVRTLEAPHPNPLPEGEGQEGMQQNDLDEVVGIRCRASLDGRLQDYDRKAAGVFDDRGEDYYLLALPIS